MKRLSLVATLFVYFVFVSSSVSTKERNTHKLPEGGPTQTKALWVFGDSVVPNPVSDNAGRTRLINGSSASGINRLFVSVYQGTPNTSGRRMYEDADIASLNTAAHTAGQEVWSAYGDTNWPTFGCSASDFPVARMAEVAAYNDAHAAAEKFDGVMLDVEPNPVTESDFQALLTHYQCMRDSLPAPIKLGAAINSFWHDPVTYPAIGGTVKPAYEHIIDLDLDSVVVMGYRDTAGTDDCPASNGIICLDKDEIAYATSINKPGLILAGLETLNTAPENVSFFEEGPVVMEVEKQKAVDYFAGSSGFGGTAIHNYTSQYLNGSATWPSPATLGSCTGANNIEVESSAGTIFAAYSTLKDAFDAINAGTHTGDIVIEVCGNTTETVSAVLNSGAAAPASYTSVLVRPVAAPRIIEGTITGATVKLNGADNATIDGRLGGVGNSRDLTVRNGSTLSATAAIWLASVASPANGATNNTIRNLEIAAGTDSTSSLIRESFGIIMAGAVIGVGSNGVDNDNNLFTANRIVKARYGIVTRGTTTNLNISPVVTDNIIGPAAFGSDQIGKVGIFMQADTGAIVSGNTVQFVGCLEPQACTGTADRMGIAIGNENWSTSPGTITSNTYTVTNNIVHDIIEETNSSSMGINLATTGGGSATNNVVANNVIYNVRGNATASDMTVGLGIAGGLGDKVVFNSIAMTGDIDPGSATSATVHGSGIRIGNLTGGTHGNLTLKNNSVYMDLSSSNAAVRFYAISGPGSTYDFGTGGENYNNYYINAANAQVQTGGLGTTPVGPALTAQFATLANWQAAYDIAQDANSIQSDPLYISNTSDLHIGSGSSNRNAGTPVAGITMDFDGDPRDASPDIGADEIIPRGTIQLSSATYSGGEGDGTISLTLTRTGGSGGAISATYGFGNGTAIGGGVCGDPSVDFVQSGGTVNFADGDIANKTLGVPICDDAVLEGDQNFSAFLTGGPLGSQTSAVVTIIDNEFPPFSGEINVGTGEAIQSLTNPGGLFEQLNAAGLSGNLTVNITSDLISETGVVSLNQLTETGVGGYGVTFQASSGARLIEGTALSASTAMINLNGADRITFDGSAEGPQGLTIRNAGTGFTIRLQNDSSNNSITDCQIEGGGSVVVYIGQGITTDNDNNFVTGNVIRDLSTGPGVPNILILNFGTSESITNSNNVIANNELLNFNVTGIFSGHADNTAITGNTISQTASRTTLLTGIDMSPQNLETTMVSDNTIRDLDSTDSVVGMRFFDPRNITAARNRIYNLTNAGGSTQVIVGILFEGAVSQSSLTLMNNIISIDPGTPSAQSIFGIADLGTAGSTINIFHNSVYISGDTGLAANSSWALFRGTNNATNHTARNNIAFNKRTGAGNHFAAGDQSANTGNYVSDNNLFVGTGASSTDFMDYGTNPTGTPVTFATWQTGPPARDGNSLSFTAADLLSTDVFVNAEAGDLHTLPTNPGLGLGAAGVASTDFDNDPRSAAFPDMGADELVKGNGGVFPAGTFYNGWADAPSTLAGDVEFTNALYLGAIVDAGSNTLTIACGANLAGGSSTSFVVGKLRRNICAPGEYIFPVGTIPPSVPPFGPEGFVIAGDYSPVTANVVASIDPDSSLSVIAYDATLAGFDPTTSISRNWALEETGNITADLSFTYVDSDVNGNESDYRVFRRADDGAFTNFCLGGPCVDTGTNTATASAVMQFSRWTVAESLIPTAARVSLGGRVLTATRRGIQGASVILSGGDLPSPRRALSNPFGFYRFEDLAVGQTYILSVNSRRYTFTVPSRAVSLNDQLTNFDFVADR